MLYKIYAFEVGVDGRPVVSPDAYGGYDEPHDGENDGGGDGDGLLSADDGDAVESSVMQTGSREDFDLEIGRLLETEVILKGHKPLMWANPAASCVACPTPSLFWCPSLRA